MLTLYLDIFIFLIFGFCIGVISIVLGFFFGQKTYNKEKISPYECGFEPFGDARLKFNIRFYLVAILFLIFDLEIIFLFPYGIVFEQMNIKQVLYLLFFLITLFIGFIYEWKKGALEWE